MLDPIRQSDNKFYVAWHSKRAFKAGKFNDRIISYDEAVREAEKLAAEHPENTYWAEHVPKVFAPH
jgi:hypothetical protein